MSDTAPPDVADVTVRQMFDAISPRYNLMNRLMTLGQDRRWRRRVVQLARLAPGGRLLDLGAGTGDIAITAESAHPDLALVVAADFSRCMMRRAPAGATISWCQVNALDLPFADESFDAVTSGYLARNVGRTALLRLFQEQRRVLRRDGRVVCLDTTPPPPGLLSPLVRLHLRRIIPLLGRVVTGHPGAYRYLPQTTQGFVSPRELTEAMQRAGLRDVVFETRMLGTQAIHSALR